MRTFKKWATWQGRKGWENAPSLLPERLQRNIQKHIDSIQRPRIDEAVKAPTQ